MNFGNTMMNWLEMKSGNVLLLIAISLVTRLSEAQQVTNQTPSAVEYSGLYNVDPEVLKREGYQPTPGETFLSIKKGLGRPKLDEMWEVQDAIETFAKKHGFGGTGLYCDPRSDDRTVYFNFPSHNHLTIQNLDRLKTLLKQEFPDWRIAVLGNKPQSTIIVYPTLVAFSEKGKEKEIIDAICKELNDEEQTKAEAKQQEQRQINWIKHILKTRTFENLELAQQPEVLAVFENGAGRNEFVCIWILNGDGGRHMPRWWPIPKNGGFYTGGHGFDVSDCGDLHPYFDLKKDQVLGMATPIWIEKENFLKTISFKSKWDKNSRWLQDLSDDVRVQLPKAGKVVQLSLEGFEIISDEKLKQKLIELGIEERRTGNEKK